MYMEILNMIMFQTLSSLNSDHSNTVCSYFLY